MSNSNIDASTIDDAFYRYKMLKMITKSRAKESIKTNIVNMVDIGKADFLYYKYFGCDLGAQSKFDAKTGISLINEFFKKYVQCYGCGNSGTEIITTKSLMIQLKCTVCGFVSHVDMKLTTFTVKNPSETKKGLKDKKAMRRAEKERLKEDVHAKASSTKKNANISDEECLSPTHSQVDEKEEVDDEDDVQKQTDTSLEAGCKCIQKQLSTFFNGVQKGFCKGGCEQELLAAVAQNEGSQLLVLRAMEELYGKQA
uniref:Translation initiation factor IF2/IF5 domain-containing protein n=1 Tax=Populus trichocarpa TaxID=3694 RepID=A0A2K1X602_POPTR